MPALWVQSFDIAAGTVTLSDGRVFNVNDVPGNGWTQNRLNKLNEQAQGLIDQVTPQSSLPVDDEERTWTAQQFTDRYGGRRFLDGNGNIVDRSITIHFTYDGDRLYPHIGVP